MTEDVGTASADRVDRLARDGLFALVGAGVTAVLNLVLVFVTIHAVGRTTAGVVFAATSAFLIAETAARLGCPTGLMYFLVRARTLGDVRQLRAILRAGLTPVVVASILLAVVSIAFAEPIGEWMAKGHGQDAANVDPGAAPSSSRSPRSPTRCSTRPARSAACARSSWSSGSAGPACRPCSPWCSSR